MEYLEYFNNLNIKLMDFLDRLKQEQQNLQEKITKLETFITSNNFTSIDQIQQSLLKVQLNSMKSYNTCLLERLSYL